MFSRILILLLALLPLTVVQAQHFEAGLLVGVSNYEGDLAPNTVKLSVGETHAAFGVFGRYNINNSFAVKLGVNYGSLSGDDSESTTEARRQRNLSFKSHILEVGLTGEWNILGFQPYNLERIFSPYLFAGVAVFNYNPKAWYNGEWVELQPLGTEGQGMPDFDTKYATTQLSIPFGIGAKYAINDKWTVGIELGLRKTFTDYLDDVSTNYVEYSELEAGNGELSALLANRTGEYLNTEPVSVETGARRGDPDNDDWYFIGGVTLSYNFLDNGLVGARNRGRRKQGCDF